MATGLHVKEIGIDTAAGLPGEIWVDGAEPRVAHHGFDHHLAQYPLEVGPLIFIKAVAEQRVPDVEPHEMDYLVYAHPQRPFFADLLGVYNLLPVPF